MKTKAITEGALTCALSVILALASYYLPLMLILFVFIPVPMVYLSKCRGFLPAFLSGVAATIICFLLMDPLSAVSFGIYILLMGCGLGLTYAKNCRPAVRVAVGFFAALITFFAYIILMQLMTGVAFMDELLNMLSASSDQVLKMYNNFGLVGDDAADVMSLVMTNVKMMIPVIAILMPALLAWINVLICDKILARMNVSIQPLKPLGEWVIPAPLRAFLVLLLLADIILDLTGFEGIPQIYSFTVFQLMEFIFILMGWSLLFWGIRRKTGKEVPMAKAALIIATFLIPFMSTLMSWAGIAEVFIGIKNIITIKDAMNK